MAAATSLSKPSQMIVTLEDNALIADIKKALKLIRGVASVRVATISDGNTSNAVLSTKTSSTSKSSYTHNLPTFPAHVVKTVKQSHTIDTHPLK
jgi:hypothetical protein